MTDTPDRHLFRRTLVRVWFVQLISLALLALLQWYYAR